MHLYPGITPLTVSAGMTLRPKLGILIDTVHGLPRSRSLSQFSSASVYDRWSTFLTDIHAFTAAAMIIPKLRNDHVTYLEQIARGRPALPMVLVTEPDIGNMAIVNTMPQLAGIIALAELAVLPQVLTSVAKRSILGEAAELIESLDHLPIELRHTLAKACRRARPIRSVDKLASEVLGGSRLSLWKLWRSVVSTGAGPHAFIDWLLLAHVHISLGERRRIEVVARGLCVDRHTIKAAMRRRLARTDLDYLRRAGRDALLSNLMDLFQGAGTDRTS